MITESSTGNVLMIIADEISTLAAKYGVLLVKLCWAQFASTLLC
jgi:hypothetical protein